MNIFKVLSRGDGTIQEPNITSVLSYLLDPTEDHGMGHLFLIKFLNRFKNVDLFDTEKFGNEFKVAETSFTNSDSELNTFIEVEKRLELELENDKKKTRDIDIYLALFKGNILLFRLIIEIKIYKESFTKDQLKDIVELSKDNLEEPDKTIYILLAPDDNNVTEESKNENFIKINWKEFISQIFEEILKKESVGTISPINNQTKDLLKSFNVFINDDFRDKDNLFPDVFKVEFTREDKEISTFRVENKKSILEFMIDVMKEILKDKNENSQRKQALLQLNEIHGFRNFIRTIENMEEYCKSDKVNEKDVKTKRYKLLKLDTLNLFKTEDLQGPINTDEYVYISTQVSAAGKINELLYFVEKIIKLFNLNHYEFKVEKRIFTGVKKPTSKRKWKKEDYFSLKEEIKS